MLPREPSWREEEKGRGVYPESIHILRERKADNLVGQNAATAETHWESLGMREGKGLRQVFDAEF